MVSEGIRVRIIDAKDNPTMMGLPEFVELLKEHLPSHCGKVNCSLRVPMCPVSHADFVQMVGVTDSEEMMASELRDAVKKFGHVFDEIKEHKTQSFSADGTAYYILREDHWSTIIDNVRNLWSKAQLS
jgi:hypothetical protein